MLLDAHTHADQHQRLVASYELSDDTDRHEDLQQVASFDLSALPPKPTGASASVFSLSSRLPRAIFQPPESARC